VKTARLHLWPEGPKTRDDETTLQATVEHPDGRREPLWFRVASSQRDALTEHADPFVIGALFLVMKAVRASGQPTELLVHGAVSPSLIRNLEECQAAWSMWVPDLYSEFSIRADVEAESDRVTEDEAGAMCFSGGVDSAFTAHRHTRASDRRLARPLRAGVMVQGMDFRPDETDLYLRAEKRSKAMLDSLGLELLRVVTNFKEINTHWGYCHGSAVASCLAILQKRFTFGLIAQTMTYANNHLTFEGVNPMTDWLYSSDSFRLIPDGAASTRVEKMAAMADWPEFLENVRVCSIDATRKDRNCCECGKCVRSILQFRTAGLGLPPAFEKDVPIEAIRELSLGPRGLHLTYAPLLEEARSRGIDEPWVDALERAVKRSHRNLKDAGRPRWATIHRRAWKKIRIMTGAASSPRTPGTRDVSDPES
jgi:hypothetical protein